MSVDGASELHEVRVDVMRSAVGQRDNKWWLRLILAPPTPPSPPTPLPCLPGARVVSSAKIRVLLSILSSLLASVLVLVLAGSHFHYKNTVQLEQG